VVRNTEDKKSIDAESRIVKKLISVQIIVIYMLGE
jgi:hypothetical protein